MPNLETQSEQSPATPKSNEQKVRDTLQSLIELFESDNAPKAIAHIALPCPDIPASKWSIGNNLLLWIAGTCDARGFRQWQEVKRFVRKGARAIYILAPNLKTISRERRTSNSSITPPAAFTAAKTENPGQDKVQVLCGFRAVPVFGFEDTDGEALAHDLTPPEPPPLVDVAEVWGLTVRYAGCSGNYLGYYRHNADRPHEITLCTHDEQVFFHELAHAAQYRVWKDIQPNQKLRKEVAAEIAACVLARLYGRKSANEGSSYHYVKTYCEANGKSLGKTLWSLVADTEQIINAILEAKPQPQPA